MVVKLNEDSSGSTPKFESRVILDGSQTIGIPAPVDSQFESRVILDGSQTILSFDAPAALFESRVILDGSQTDV